MNNDYLWDGSGEPDPDIQRLENTLTKFRHQGQALEFPAVAAARNPCFGNDFRHLIGPSDSQQRPQQFCLSPRSEFCDGVRSRMALPDQDGTSRVSRGRRKSNPLPSGKMPEAPSLVWAKRWSQTAIRRPIFPSPISER